MTHDRVTTLGTGVDGAVRRLTAAFEVRGMASKLTSYDNATVGSGSIVNEVGLTYNSFGQLVTDAQSHSGAVVPGTTPAVQYAYANGSANMIRPTTLTYPNGRAITVSYGTSGGINDAASRVDALIDGATTLVNYAYLGLGTAVQTTYPQPAIQHTLLGSAGGNDPTTGDIYWGLDLFGRVKDSRWFKTTTPADIDRIQYGYDRASNRIWRQNPVATANATAFDEFYTNDGLQRLKDMQRGTLNGTNTAITSPNFSQCWTLDPTGNWRGFNESTTGSSWTLTQARTANPVNEITGITNSVGAAWVAPAYDAAGNMTTMPRPSAPTTGFTAVYDAWNRLVTVRAGVSNVQQNQYDARNFRVALLNYSGGVLSETRHAYFTSGWQCIEERVDAATTASRHFIWGARYIDDLVMRDRDSTGGSTFNQRNYALQDANWNVTTAVSSSGTVQERYAYSPYGTPTFLTPTFGPRANTSLSWETLFCGYRLDNNSRLYAVRFRVYHPALGSWCQRDPMQFWPFTNVFSYVQSRPTRFVDPFGLEPENGSPSSNSALLMQWSFNTWQSLDKTLVDPTTASRLLQNGNYGCIGFCSAELGIPYSHNFGKRPDLSKCFTSIDDARLYQASPEATRNCRGTNCRGTPRRPRLVNIQFHNGQDMNTGNSTLTAITPSGDGKTYNLNEHYELIWSGGPGGVFPSADGTADVIFNNYDFSIELHDGTWLHGSNAYEPPKYSSLRDLRFQFRNTGPRDLENGMRSDSENSGAYSFNIQFFCVVCEEDYSRPLPF